MTKEELIDEMLAFYKRLLDDHKSARTRGRRNPLNDFDAGYRAAYYDALMEVVFDFNDTFGDELNLEEYE